MSDNLRSTTRLSNKSLDEPQWLKEVCAETEPADWSKAYPADWLEADNPARPRERKPRRPSLKDVVKQAEAVGLPVQSVTVTRDGITLQIGEPEADKLNDLDAELAAFEARHNGQG